MTKKKAKFWLESIVRNHGGTLHKEALSIIFPEQGESRPTVLAKRPVQQVKVKKANPAPICIKTVPCKNFLPGSKLCPVGFDLTCGEQSCLVTALKK
jgi:hypothetical protein